ncbi:MAG: IS3 family transposase, partial [Candidatus Limnocylindria bacterium]
MRDPGGVVIAFPKRGPRTEISDERLLELIREVIDESPFSGEGHRKITAYLRRKKKVHVGRKRVLRIMRANGCSLLSATRGAARPVPTTEPSSLRARIFCGERTRPWRGPRTTAGCGPSAVSTTSSQKHGPRSPSGAIASPASSRSTTRS